ncbi:MAG: hypothetical protein V1784_10215 [bacterium]
MSPFVFWVLWLGSTEDFSKSLSLLRQKAKLRSISVPNSRRSSSELQRESDSMEYLAQASLCFALALGRGSLLRISGAMNHSNGDRGTGLVLAFPRSSCHPFLLEGFVEKPIHPPAALSKLL